MARRYRRNKPQYIQIVFWLLVLAAIWLSFRTREIPFIPILTITLLLGVGVALGAAYVVHAQNNHRREKARALQTAAVDRLSGVGFERYVGEILRWRGYKIKFTPVSNDFGIDIIATKHGQTYGIQVKRYDKRALGQEAIREVVAGMAKYGCAHGLVITNSFFTGSAKELAQANNCELIDRDRLAEWVLAFQQNRK